LNADGGNGSNGASACVDPGSCSPSTI
jgi:hypothetical protein